LTPSFIVRTYTPSMVAARETRISSLAANTCSELDSVPSTSARRRSSPFGSVRVVGVVERAVEHIERIEPILVGRDLAPLGA
jgi:hypothetical protein